MHRKPLRRAARLIDVRGELDRNIALALSLARSETPFTDDRVHSIRKHLKRARAVLRLLRDAVTKDAYTKQNRLLRDAGRPLARARDAAVMLQEIDKLASRKWTKVHRATFGRLRDELQRRHARLLAELRYHAARARIGGPIAEAQERIKRWHLPRDSWSILAPGLRRVYARGRKALGRVGSTKTDRTLHELRKQAKYLELAMAALEPAKVKPASKIADSAGAIAKRLGEDRDLAVLDAALRKAKAGPALFSRFAPLRRKLQKEALKRAERLYRRRPKGFVAKVGHTRSHAA